MQHMRTLTATVALISANCFGQNLLLSCNVQGTFDSQSLGSATITVKIENSKDYIDIDIDGPADYQGGFTSLPYDKENIKSEGKNLSDANNFVVDTKRIMKGSGNYYETNVRLNRVTGMFYLMQEMTNIKGVTYSKAISGSCKPIKSVNKF